MPKYVLATHTATATDTDTADAAAAREPMTEAEMQATWQRLSKVEDEMKASGAWFFSGRLHDPDTATVVRMASDEVVTTDGPFVEAKEHVAGFYIVEAPDLDAALGWAAKVTACIGAPIEVRPFRDVAH